MHHFPPTTTFAHHLLQHPMHASSHLHQLALLEEQWWRTSGIFTRQDGGRIFTTIVCTLKNTQEHSMQLWKGWELSVKHKVEKKASCRWMTKPIYESQGGWTSHHASRNIITTQQSVQLEEHPSRKDLQHYICIYIS